MEPVFLPFLKSLERNGNQHILESVERGYSILFEDSVTKMLRKFKHGDRNTYDNFLILAEDMIMNYPKLEKFDKNNRYNPNGLKKWMTMKGHALTGIHLHTMESILEFLDVLVATNEDATKKMWNKFGNTDFNFDNLSEIYHRHLKKEAEKKDREEKVKIAATPEYKDNKTVLPFPDGFKWVTNPKGFCDIEAELMGHCGNRPSVRDGDVLFSLRDKDNLPYLTFIVNTKEFTGLNVLGESKGRGNDKPPTKLHKYIVPFLIKFVDFISGGGYEPEHNFELRDLSEADKKKVLEAKPGIDNVKIILAKLKDPKEKANALGAYLGWPHVKKITKDGKYALMDTFSSLEDLYNATDKDDDDYGRVMDSFDDWFPDVSYDDFYIDHYANEKVIEKMKKIAKVDSVEDLKECINDEENHGSELKSAIMGATDDGYRYGAEGQAYKDIKNTLSETNDLGFFVRMKSLEEIYVYFSLDYLDTDNVKEMREHIMEGDDIYSHYSWDYKQPYNGYDDFDEEAFNERLNESLAEIEYEIKEEAKDPNQTEMSL